jgi:hypothetical protein
MQSKAKTVAAYLKELSPDRRRAIEAVRKVILDNLPKGYEETMNYGMIGYVVPHKIYPAGYHCDPSLPLPFASLASQKHYMSLYVMSLYGPLEDWFRAEFQKSGKKLDMGKCCVRFRKIEDLPLDVVGRLIGSVSVRDFVAWCETARNSRKSSAGSRAASAKRRTSTKPRASSRKSVR